LYFNVLDGRCYDEALKALRTVADFELLREKPLAIVLKHSTACSVSARARREALAFLGARPDQEIYEVYVLEHRAVSDHIQEATGIRHESPQLLVLRRGEVHWHGSHSSVTAEAIAAAVA
jgi:bacillithiol system protein YtxJ